MPGPARSAFLSFFSATAVVPVLIMVRYSSFLLELVLAQPVTESPAWHALDARVPLRLGASLIHNGPKIVNHKSPLFEIARVLVRFDHVASLRQPVCSLFYLQSITIIPIIITTAIHAAHMT